MVGWFHVQLEFGLRFEAIKLLSANRLLGIPDMPHRFPSNLSIKIDPNL